MDSAELATALDANVRSDLYFDDPHGTVEHRRHLTYYYAEEIRVELQADDQRLEKMKVKGMGRALRSVRPKGHPGCPFE